MHFFSNKKLLELAEKLEAAIKAKDAPQVANLFYQIHIEWEDNFGYHNGLEDSIKDFKRLWNNNS